MRDIIDPTPGIFIGDKLNPNEQNLQNTTDSVLNLPPQVQQQLNETVFKNQLHQKLFQMLFQKLKTFLLTMMNLFHLKSLNQR